MPSPAQLPELAWPALHRPILLSLAICLSGAAVAADLNQPPVFVQPPPPVILFQPPPPAEPLPAPAQAFRPEINDQLIGHGDPFEALPPGYLEGDLYVRTRCRANPILQSASGRGDCRRVGLIQTIAHRSFRYRSSLAWSLYGRRSLNVIATGCHCTIDDN